MKNWTTSIRAIGVFTILTGLLYPLGVTLVGKLFPEKSGGSLVVESNQVRGSTLIGQPFTNPKYFRPRPSAVKYDASSSGASNQSVTSGDLLKLVKEREAQGLTNEMLFASASGLDPHISPEAALAQLNRVVEARKLNPDQSNALKLLLEAKTDKRQFGFLGQPRMNVLVVNMALDEQFGK